MTRPVRPLHIEMMAMRVGWASADMTAKAMFPGDGSPEFRRAGRDYHRRMAALRRLAEALERQATPEATPNRDYLTNGLPDYLTGGQS